jgi:hypothetical protein
MYAPTAKTISKNDKLKILAETPNLPMLPKKPPRIIRRTDIKKRAVICDIIH